MKTILAAILAAVGLFLWGFVFWTVLNTEPVKPVVNEAEVAAFLSQNLPEDGAYGLPQAGMQEMSEAFIKAHEQGPIATIFIRHEGAPPMAGSVFLHGYLQMLLATLMMSVVLKMVVGSLGSYGQRVLFVTLAGLTGSMFAHLSYPIWWYQPWTYHINSTVYDGVGWLIAGLVLAWFIRPESSA